MAAPQPHTPLEMLVLFQSLDPLDENPPSFIKISDSLKNNILIRESESYDPARLDPNSLTQLYLKLMKDEAKAEVLESGNFKEGENAQSNQPQKSPSSPLLDTVNEASRRIHLLPSLLNRLYFRYRNHAIKAIEADEHKYRLLQKDIQEINRGEWDARLQQHQEIASKRDTKGGVTSIQTLLHHELDVTKPRTKDSQHPAKSPQKQDNTITLSPGPPTERSSIEDVQPKSPQRQHNSIALQSSQPVGVFANPSLGSSGVLAESKNGALEEAKPAASEPISQQIQAHSPPGDHWTAELLTHPRISPPIESQQLPGVQDSKARPQPLLSDKSKPFLPPPHAPNSGHPLASPDIARRIPPYPPTQPQTSGAHSQSPRLQHTPLATQERSSQPPIILPPPAGMIRSSGSSLGSLDTLADMAGQQQFRSNSALPSPRPVQLPGAQTHPIQLPQPRNYPLPVYPYYDSQQPYGVPYPYPQGHVTQYHHSNQATMPIYPGPATSPGRVPIYGNVPLYQSPSPSYSQYPGYSQGPSYYQTPVQTQHSRTQAPRFSEQRTPVSGISDRNRPPRPSPINTTVSSTKWKNVDAPGSVRSPRSPIRPRPEEISPLSDKALSPFPESLQDRSKELNNHRGRRKRGGSARGGNLRGRGARAASAASSTAAGSAQARTRSQSLISHADELSMDKNVSQTHAIKPEPSATPAGDEDTSITETTADEGSRKSTRRRRGTLRGFELTEVSRTGMKRKHTLLETPIRSASPTSFALPNPRPNHVLGSRNFPRTSATIMNDISAHKLASMFAKPLTDREAPGYKDLIYRPQDLKSIRSAILAGSKALVSAADNHAPSSFGDAGSPAGSGTPTAKSASVWIPASADVVPPKGIVNSAQLEKELMRMFANAVMFNPDPKRGVGPSFRDRSGRCGGIASGGDGEHDGDGAGDKEEAEMEEEEEEEEEGGVVKDTREMYEAVERSVSHWRAAERAVEDFAMVIGGPVGGVSGGGTGGFQKGSVARLRGGDKDEDGEDELAVEEGGAGGATVARDDEDGGGGKRRRR